VGLDPQTETIDGHKWTVCPFPARRAIQLKVRLAKAVGPAIAELLPALGAMPGGKDADKGADKDAPKDADKGLGLDLSVMPKVISALASNLGEEESVQTILDLMALSSRDDTAISPDHFDNVFAGNYGEMYKALWFILKVNYADFIKGVGGSAIGSRLKALTKETPKT